MKAAMYYDFGQPIQIVNVPKPTIIRRRRMMKIFHPNPCTNGCCRHHPNHINHNDHNSNNNNSNYNNHDISLRTNTHNNETTDAIIKSKSTSTLSSLRFENNDENYTTDAIQSTSSSSLSSLRPENNDDNNDTIDHDCVIIKVMATGICRSDWHGWKGHDNDIIKHGLPFIPGHEMTGMIVDMSDDLMDCNNDKSNNHDNHNKNKNQRFHIGDRVIVPFILSCHQCVLCCHYQQPTVCLHQIQPGFTMFGSYAEYVKIPRAYHHIIRIPHNVSYAQATSLGCRFTTAYRALLYHGQLLSSSQHENHTNKKTPINKCALATTTTKSIPTTTIPTTTMPTTITIRPIIMSKSHPHDDTSYCHHGKTIAIFGCGGLGLSCIMLANGYQQKYQKENKKNHDHGLLIHKIIAVDISQDALNKAKSINPILIETIHIPSSSSSSSSTNQMINQEKNREHAAITIQSIMSLTPYQLGADIVMECSGVISSHEIAIQCTRPGGGKMIQVGILSNHSTTPTHNNNSNVSNHKNKKDNNHRQHKKEAIIPSSCTTTKTAASLMNHVLAKEIQIIGSHGFHGSHDLSILLEMISNQYIHPELLIQQQVSLRQGIQILQNMDHSSPLGMTLITSFHEEEDPHNIPTKEHHHHDIQDNHHDPNNNTDRICSRL
jgi:D-arabinose 1-dehydrogenase-like Zn-dependent alcohol dehydrogenase